MIHENLEYAMFSRKEMEGRYACARELMERRGIDALLISGEENFQYFAGTAASLALHYSLTRPSLFILPMDREPIIVSQGKDNLVLGSYVTDIRVFNEILAEGQRQGLEAGIAVSSSPPDAMASAVSRLAEDPQRIDALGADARTLVQQSFSATHMAAAYEDLYDSLGR